MDHSFYFYGMSSGQFECVFGLRSGVWFPVDKQISALSFPYKFGINPPIPEGMECFVGGKSVPGAWDWVHATGGTPSDCAPRAQLINKTVQAQESLQISIISRTNYFKKLCSQCKPTLSSIYSYSL